jgi:3-oxoacyl-[acyl-carrier protein] reductase
VLNTTAIVTGASQGIGRSTAISLAKDFSALALVARGKEKLQKVADEVKKIGAQAIILDIDLSDPLAGKRVVEETLKTFGRIDALLNIAGAMPQIDIFEMTDQQWHDGTELKLHGARRLTIAAWPSLKESKGSGRDRGTDGVPSFAECQVHDRHNASYGRRQGQDDLKFFEERSLYR